jgi:hypothetical protein
MDIQGERWPVSTSDITENLPKLRDVSEFYTVND